jgi:hypothetical protein
MVSGNLEQVCASQNIGHGIGHSSRPGVTVRAADCLAWRARTPRPSDRHRKVAAQALRRGLGHWQFEGRPNILTRRLGMKVNRGACQTRHGIEDVVSVLSIAASIWSERLASWSVSQAVVISPAAANARCRSPLAA